VLKCIRALPECYVTKELHLLSSKGEEEEEDTEGEEIGNRLYKRRRMKTWKRV